MINHLLIPILTLFSLHWCSAQYYHSFPGKLFRINNVEISSDDGFSLKGTMYSSTSSAPGIVLLPMMGIGQRFDYESLATQLAIEGFHVLTIDLRGQGESLSMESYNYNSETLAGDEDAAIRFIRKQPGCLNDQIAVIGASGTVAEAVAMASRHGEVKALVGLSGHADSLGLNFLSQPYSPPILGIGAVSDSIMTKMSGNWQIQTTAETMNAVVSHSNHSKSQLMIYQHATHGTAMLEEKEELVPTIVEWLQKVLE